MSKSLLTKKQKQTIEWCATNDHVTGLYEEWSLSGASLTVRYTARWVEQTRWGAVPRFRTGMVLSHSVAPFEDEADKAAYEEAQMEIFRAKKEEAYRLFEELRSKKVAA